MDKDKITGRVFGWYAGVLSLSICLAGVIFLSPSYAIMHRSSLRPTIDFMTIGFTCVILIPMLFKGTRQTKICPFALSSVICLSMAPVFLVIAMALDDGLNEYVISGFLFKYCLLACIFTSPVLALIGFYRIVFRKIQLAGVWFSIAVIGLLTFQILVPLTIKNYRRYNPPPRAVCANRMSSLFIAMRFYVELNGELPTMSKWCDLLHLEMDVTKKWFVCPEDKKGPCSYAMNEFVTSEKYKSENLVILFESGAGWNQVGGPELFNTDNHDGTGGFVVFGDGSRRFVKPEDIWQLRWKPGAGIDEAKLD